MTTVGSQSCTRTGKTKVKIQDDIATITRMIMRTLALMSALRIWILHYFRPPRPAACACSHRTTTTCPRPLACPSRRNPASTRSVAGPIRDGWSASFA